MLLLSPLLSWIAHKFRVIVPKKNWVILTLPIGVVIHIVVGTFTPMTKNTLMLNDHYVLKFILVVFLLFGLRGIKIDKSKMKK
jgi:hypothetical protein